MPELDCQVCDKNPAQGVASIPGIPISLAWCQTCLQTGCYGPYDIHWINLSLLTAPIEDDSDYELLHQEIVKEIEAGRIRQEMLDMIVWRDGYKTMREALDDGPPRSKHNG